MRINTDSNIGSSEEPGNSDFRLGYKLHHATSWQELRALSKFEELIRRVIQFMADSLLRRESFSFAIFDFMYPLLLKNVSVDFTGLGRTLIDP